MTLPLSPIPSNSGGSGGSASSSGSSGSGSADPTDRNREPGHSGQPEHPSQPSQSQPQSLYEAVGGEETFRRIVHEFYRQIPDDPVLGPMYPTDDLAGAEDRLRWFLVQYWGGPQTFSERRGHPRLRMRHSDFAVNAEAREHWLLVMSNALATIEEEDLPDPARKAVWDHMVRVADMLINRD